MNPTTTSSIKYPSNVPVSGDTIPTTPPFDIIGFLGILFILVAGLANPLGLLFPIEGVLLGIATRYGSTGTISLLAIIVAIIFIVPGCLSVLYMYGRYLEKNHSSNSFFIIPHVQRLDQQIKNHGTMVYYIGMITPLRNLIGILAGSNSRPFGWFVLHSSIATISWFTLIASIFYTIGSLLPIIKDYSFTIAIAVAIISHIFYFIVLHSRLANTRTSVQDDGKTVTNTPNIQDTTDSNAGNPVSTIPSPDTTQENLSVAPTEKPILPHISCIIVNGVHCILHIDTAGNATINTPLLELIHRYQLPIIVATDVSGPSLATFAQLSQHYHWTLCSYGESLPLSSASYRNNLLHYYHLDPSSVLVIDHIADHLSVAQSIGINHCLLYKDTGSLQSQLHTIETGQASITPPKPVEAENTILSANTTNVVKHEEQSPANKDFASLIQLSAPSLPKYFHYIIDALDCLIESDASHTVETFSLNNNLLNYIKTNGISVTVITDEPIGPILDKISTLITPHHIELYTHHGKPSLSHRDFFQQFLMDHPTINPSKIVYIYHNAISGMAAQNIGISHNILHQTRELTKPILDKFIATAQTNNNGAL